MTRCTGNPPKSKRKLFTLGGDDRSIENSLEILAGVPGNAERQLWGEPLALIVDRMGLKRAALADTAPELHSAAGRRLVMVSPADAG